MSRLRATSSLLTAAALAGAVAAGAPASALASAGCSALAPRALHATPLADASGAVLRWNGPRRAGLAWRVLRDGRTVRQTAAHQMRVPLPGGPRHVLTVLAVLHGHPSACRAKLRVNVKPQVPSPVTGVTARPGANDTLRLRWERATRGSAPLAGYRVLRDGKTLRQLKARTLVVQVVPTRVYRFQVVAVDTRGRTGRRSAAVTVKVGHVAPTVPTALAVADTTDTAATLSWAPSTAFGGQVTGYRILRDGKTMRGVQGTSVRLEGLPSARSMTFTVQAVDTYGWTSALSSAVTVVTGHHAPGAPAGLYAASVGDTQLQLAWSPGAVPAGSALRGYRIIRDGKVVSQVASAPANIGNLGALSTHQWQVAAVDTLGYVSDPSAPITVQQARPPQSTGKAQAFLLASTGASFTAFQRHYTQIGVVYPTYFDCNTTTGALVGKDDPLVTRWSQDRGIKVLPRINCQNTAILHKIITDPALRASWIDGVTNLVQQNGYDGINVDFETAAATDRDAMTAFVTDLAARMHAAGKLISQDVSAKTADVPNHPRSTAFDYVALAQQNDWVIVMAWGIHWATSAPGAQDDIRWFKQVADYVTTVPNHQKFLMGDMLYGMDWPNGGGAANPAGAWYYGQIQDIIARTGAQPVRDADADSLHLAYTDANGVPHDIWYSDAAAIHDRMAIARAHGLGTAFWRVGQEDERIWADPLLAP